MEFDNTNAAYDVLNSHKNRLFKFKQLTKIRLTGVQLSIVIPELRSLIFFKIIVLRGWFNQDNWIDWSEAEVVERYGRQYLALPQVEELQIQGGTRKLIHSYMKQLARQWLNLKRILLPECDSFDTTHHIAELNRLREKLKDACKINNN